MVGCDFQNNGCQNESRAGTLNAGYALRCKFTSVNRAFQGYNGSWIINSLILNGTFYSKCKLVNCTFFGTSCPRNATTYNSLFIGTGATYYFQKINDTKSTHQNTYSRSGFDLEYCTPDAACRTVSEDETPYDETTFRPLAGSAVIDAAKTSYYVSTTNKWVSAWLAEADKDYYGNDRCVNGAIDVGCGEKQPVEGSPLAIVDALDGLVVEGAEKGESQLVVGADYPITLSRTLTSDRLCLGVMINGVFHSFGGTTSNVPCSVTLHGQQGQDNRIAAVYETNQKDWYVNPNGDNTNKGYHKDCPRRTLDKAMELATANASNIVHAAAGTYDSFAEGANYASASSRVSVKAGVGLVADEWPLKETIIKGAKDTTAEADTNGNGPNAVRCVFVNNNGYVRGFKLTGGRTSFTNLVGTAVNATPGAVGGGAVLYSGALVDCEVTGNGTPYRGSGVAANGSGAVIRCNVHDQVSGDYGVYGGVLINSYLKGICYSCTLVLSSTVTEQVRANSAARTINTYFRDVARNMSCTNCASIRPAKTAIGTGASYDPNTCLFEVTPSSDNIDGNYRPKTASRLIDAGSKALYDAWFPTKWVQFKDDDVANGQRIYNGQIDIGCGEYDFRGDFAALLGPRAIISEMGPNVTTNAARNVVVPDGESITVAMAPLSSSRNTCYTLVYTPEGGSPAAVSEKSTAPFSRTLDGACTVQSLDGYVGFMFLIR